MITLYHCNTSYASHKARLFLAEKKINWTSVHIDLRQQEHISGDYRLINPKGTVPALKDDKGEIHCGSTELMFYLEDTYPEPALLPSNPKQRLLIHQFCRTHEALHDPHIRTLSYHRLFLNPDRRDNRDGDQLLELASHHPDPKRGQFLQRAIRGELSTSEIKKAHNAIIQALLIMEQHLQDNENFLFGSNYCIADVVGTATLYRLTQLEMTCNINVHPLLANYYQRMQARPSFSISLTPK